MRKLLFIAITGFLISCTQNTKTTSTENPNNQPKEETEQLDWLVGKWKRTNEEAGKETFENWDKINESEYSGIGFTLQGSDTISQELMQIIKSNGKWALFVKTAKEKEATKFELAELLNNQFTFINDSIDFPNKIHYKFENEKIHAVISNSQLEIPFEFAKN